MNIDSQEDCRSRTKEFVRSNSEILAKFIFLPNKETDKIFKQPKTRKTKSKIAESPVVKNTAEVTDVNALILWFADANPEPFGHVTLATDVATQETADWLFGPICINPKTASIRNPTMRIEVNTFIFL